jgi:hypothetical protein
MADTYGKLAAADVLALEPNWVDPKTEYKFDNIPVRGTSPIQYIDTRHGTYRWEGSMRWDSHTHEEFYTLYTRWQDNMGRTRSFWLPSWLADFQPSGGTGVNQGYLDVVRTGFQNTYDALSDLKNEPFTRDAGLESRWGVMIVQRDGSKHFRMIAGPDHAPAGYAVQGGLDRITFEEDGGNEFLPDNLDVSDIVLISLVYRARSIANSLAVRPRSADVVSVQHSFTQVYYEGVPA